MQAAVELSGLPLDDNMKPEYQIMTRQELASDLCVPGKEHQCEKYQSFSPPMSNKIILSSDLHPETSIRDQSIIYHESVKYLLFINGKQNPNYSCDQNYAMEAQIFKSQLTFISYQMSRGEAGATSVSGDEIMNMDKGSYMVWCSNTPTTEIKSNPNLEFF